MCEYALCHQRRLTTLTYLSQCSRLCAITTCVLSSFLRPDALDASRDDIRQERRASLAELASASRRAKGP